MTINQAFTILSKAGGVRAARIITENIKNLSRFRVWKMARMLRRDVPVAKIVGQKWFYGLQFFTDKYTLDPRPDTETLVAAVVSDFGAQSEPISILDLGTGTGCIIISLMKNVCATNCVALDVSRRALKITRKNVKRYGLESWARLIRGSFYNPKLKFKNKFDVIVSNPPYIARGDMRVDSGAMHDPELALYAPDDGYGAYLAIAKNAREWIRKGGRIYLEIGIDMGRRVREIFENMGWTFVRSDYDLANVERVLVFEYLK
ncbi:MAG: peptide chain release factor N(5)-glutamine methyltransferase [Alphaproteobacteria bacterium]|nr:peptide chain release factor N(5)-glutamine methyltransferase [Alphaproteobacteria bacterium]